ncbi:MAG: efflux RND transporter periplasmic adaptor subunit [Gammaproteobacteria bacterium]|nr:efflux RND transporter periplasmic adaptor subunit [Gammaproteobacteria bacterium]
MNISATHAGALTLVAALLAGCAQETQERSWNIGGVSERDIIVSVQAAGIIEPVTTVELKSKASGEILEISSETGDTVEAGILLVQIDKRTPRNALSQANAELEAAKARRDIAKSQRDRAESLFKTGTLNQVDLEQSVLEYANSRAEVVRAEVAVENARIALDDTEVRAPIRGTVISRDVEVGQVISSPTMDVGGGTVLLTMADLRSVQVRSLVDETDIGKISAGQEATVTVAAYPNQPFVGTVVKVEPKAEDEEAVTLFAVIVTIENESGLLKPGMNAEVEIDIASRYGVPAVPTIALRTPRDVAAAALFTGIDEDIIRQQLRDTGMDMPDAVSGASGDYAGAQPASASGPTGDGYQFGGRYWLFVMDGDVPVARNVVTGVTDLDYSEVVSGVTPGDKILLLPSSDLIMSQDQFKKWMGRTVGMPGMSSDSKDK